MDESYQLHSQQSQAILKKRAAALSAEKVEKDIQGQDYLLSFYIGEEKYAINYENIDRVIPFQKITLLPGISPCIAGLIYHDGEVLAVVNLSNMLNISMRESSTQQSNFVLITHQNRRIALWTDSIMGQITYDKTNVQLANLRTQQNQFHELFQGIYQTDITILNAHLFFEEAFFNQ